MSVSGDASYRNELFQAQSKMYDLAKAIQEDRRHQADMYRVVSNLPKGALDVGGSVSPDCLQASVGPDPAGGL